MNLPTVRARVERILELEGKATKGPWVPVRSATCGHLRAEHNHRRNAREEWTDDDMNLLATLRNESPRLLRVLLAALSEVEATRKAFRTCGDGETVVWFNNGQPKTSVGGDGVQAMIDTRDATDAALRECEVEL